MKQKSTGSKRTASAGSAGRSKAAQGDRYPYLAICVYNRGNEASLQLGKAYKVIKPRNDDPSARLRVVDEEGEDYLYLRDWFVPVAMDVSGKRRVMEVVA